MQPLLEFIHENFNFLYGAALVWILAITLASVVYRQARHKPLGVPTLENALFIERWTSGRSLRTPIGRLGMAKNCLFVAVTETDLVVRPHFPFSLMFLPETFGLELRVPRAKVRQVLSVPGGTDHRVLVEVEPAEGPAFRIELHLRSPEKFRIAMATCK